MTCLVVHLVWRKSKFELDMNSLVPKDGTICLEEKAWIRECNESGFECLLCYSLADEVSLTVGSSAMQFRCYFLHCWVVLRQERHPEIKLHIIWPWAQKRLGQLEFLPSLSRLLQSLRPWGKGLGLKHRGLSAGVKAGAILGPKQFALFSLGDLAPWAVGEAGSHGFPLWFLA